VVVFELKLICFKQKTNKNKTNINTNKKRNKKKEIYNTINGTNQQEKKAILYGKGVVGFFILVQEKIKK